MTSVAQQDGSEDTFSLGMTGTDGGCALRQTAAERLARHRSRRAARQQGEATAATQPREEPRTAVRSGVSRVREAVAARYERTESYREYLAAEADRALQQAEAEAEVANRKARAMAEAQMQLLQELEEWNEPESSPREQALAQARTESRGELAHALADIALGARELIREPSGEPAGGPAELLEVPSPLAPSEARPEKPLTEISSGGLTIRLYDGLETVKPMPADLKPNRQRLFENLHAVPEELHQLDQEIELRHGTEVLPPYTLETTPIPANIIEFPRELIAPRKARPRLAEGPLREDAAPEPQLRIFEVEPERISTDPLAPEPTAAPVWQELLLDAQDGSAVASRISHAGPDAQFTFPPQVAPIGRRLFSAAVDGFCLLAAVAGFLEIAGRCGGARLLHGPKPLLGVALGGALLVFFAAYGMLFFTLSESTPGMRAARIALCTFGDDNPSRKAMRLRVLATLLAACPLGVGLLWLFLDDQELGWHDRMSRMYQRAY